MNNLLKLLLSKHPYVADLPYNLGWQRRLPAGVGALLEQNLIEVYDIGARNVSLPELDPLKHLISYVGFDADKEECAKLSARPPVFKRQRFLPHYVSDREGPVEFNLVEERGCSSRFLPAERFAALFATDPQARVEKTITLDGMPLDAIRKAHGLPLPDLIKIDTQGSELDILKSFERELAGVPLVECEVEFVEQYAGQPLFHDVAAWMYERGYELVYLNRVFKQRSRIYSGAARGQIIFGDALFCKKESFFAGLPVERLRRLVVLLWCYGHVDLAYQCYTEHLASDGESKALAGLFEKIRYNSAANRIRQFVIGKIDTLAILWLALRKTNGLRTEQDRCWPIR